MSSLALLPPRHSVERYLALIGSGEIGPDDRVELLEGVIVAMTPQNPAHAFTVNRTAQVLIRAVGDLAAVRAQTSLVLEGTASIPEPDVAVVPGRDVDYRDHHPTSALLVVEVSDTTLASDRLSKVAIYAAAAIPEYWIVNLREQVVERHLEPDRASGRYGRIETMRCGETIEIAALPGHPRVDVQELFGRGSNVA